MSRIFVDADGCPVKNEVCRVAHRYSLAVVMVANSWMRTPGPGNVELRVVDDEFNAADDWIVEQLEPQDIVVTADIPLASRCLNTGARVLSPKGRVFSEDTIGDALATRDLMAYLRDGGEITRGPAPFAKKDRSRFLQRLDETIQAIRRERKS